MYFVHRIILYSDVSSRRLNAKYTDLCAPIEIDRIEWANRMEPNEGLLKFHHAADPDGFVPDMSAKTKITDIYLQIKVITRQPANAVFEFSCQYNNNTKQYTINVSFAPSYTIYVHIRLQVLIKWIMIK